MLVCEFRAILKPNFHSDEPGFWPCQERESNRYMNERCCRKLEIKFMLVFLWRKQKVQASTLAAKTVYDVTYELFLVANNKFAMNADHALR